MTNVNNAVKLPKMPKDVMISEILNAVKTFKDKESRIRFLRENNSLPLRDILRGAFDDSVVWLFTAGWTPSYKENTAPVGLSPTSLRSQSAKLAYFAKNGPGENISPLRREKLYVDLLESIHSEEAKLVINVINKNVNNETYRGITKELVKAAFPGLIKSK